MAGRKLNSSVTAYDTDGVLVTLNAGDEAPEWAEFGDHLFDDAEADTASDVEKSLDDFTVPQLKAYAADEGIDLGGATTKPEIRAAIDAAEAAKAASRASGAS